MNIGEVLNNALFGSDQQTRAFAEAQLEDAATNHFIPFMELLVQELGSEKEKEELRLLAAIAMKNQLSSKEPVTQRMQEERWVAMDPNVKKAIRDTAIATLSSPAERAANGAAQLVAAIAVIDLPRNDWPELMVILVKNTNKDQTPSTKKASLKSIGYICDGSNPVHSGISAQAGGILTAIVQGAGSDEPDMSVRITALKALVESLGFVQVSFREEGARNYIMQVVCEATQASSNELKATAYGAMGKIMDLYYEYMEVYMAQALFGLTCEGMKSDDDMVACMAVEFWSTVCEQELLIKDDIEAAKEDPSATSNSADSLPKYFEFATKAITAVLPTLLSLLTRQFDDVDDDDWSVAMAAAACLILFAQNTQNAVAEPTLAFVHANIASPDWKHREAAVMAFGSIIDGPDHDKLTPIIADSLPTLINLTRDESLHVKDTTAWCLGRIADLAVGAIRVDEDLPGVMSVLLAGLSDHPKIATNCCWAVMNLTEQLNRDAASSATGPMSRYYESFIPVLLQAASKADNEYSSRTSAFEALSVMVTYSADDVQSLVTSLTGEVLSCLYKTIPMQQQLVGVEDRANLEELQVNALNLLTNSIRRMGQLDPPAANQFMTVFLALLENKLPNSLIEDDIFMAVGSVASSIEDVFVAYLEGFNPFILKALSEPELTVCNTAVGLVADLSHSLGQNLQPFVPGYMEAYSNILAQKNVRRELKPMILSCIGDIASSIGLQFEPYLAAVISLCTEASKLTQSGDSSIDFLQYLITLREALLDAYVGIVAGLRGYPDLLAPYVKVVLGFLSVIASDQDMLKSESVVRSMVGLLGDIASMYPGGQMKEFFGEPWISEIINKSCNDLNFEQITRDTARWAREQHKRQLI